MKLDTNGRWWSDVRSIDNCPTIFPGKKPIDLAKMSASTHFYRQECFDCTNYHKSIIIFLDIKFINCIFIDMTPISNLIMHNCIFKDCIFINTSFTPNFFFSNKIENLIKFPETEYSKQKTFLNQWYPLACPEEGSFIGWKKTYSYADDSDLVTECLVKLEIPADALRSSSFGRKCRASKARVLSIFNLNAQKYISESHSIQDPEFIYKVGETITPQGDPFCKDRFVECGPGIHFYISKADAINHC